MKKGVVRITYGPHPFDIGVSKKNQSKKKKATTIVVAFGAATQIRTGDLILTKDALYRLSYSSVKQLDYYITDPRIVKRKKQKNRFLLKLF